MARITVQDCLNQEKNRFRLVRVASKRAKQILDGDNAQLEGSENRSVVSALREIADGAVGATTSEPPTDERSTLDADKFFSAIDEHLQNH